MKKILAIVITALFLSGCFATLEKQRREQFIQNNLNLSEGKIEIGMTKEQVIASLGEPRYKKVEHDLNFDNIGEEWTYGELDIHDSNAQDYLYFEKGKLVDMAKTSMINNKRREQYIKQHLELSEHMKTWIAKGWVELGMTKEQVVASVGRTSHTNRNVGSWGVHEQWVYEHGIRRSDYLYFENGILTSYSD